MSDHTYRVLVTISRGYPDVKQIHHKLDHYLAYAESLGRTMTLIHGDYKRGSDAIADAWGVMRQKAGRPVLIDPHPAQNHPTQDFGSWPAAGQKRNEYMVSLRPHVCLAFIGPCTSPRCRRSDPHPSHGATGCADMALKAGIVVDSSFRRPQQ